LGQELDCFARSSSIAVLAIFVPGGMAFRSTWKLPLRAEKGTSFPSSRAFANTTLRRTIHLESSFFPLQSD
jgi:hypothetical protein